MNFINDDIVTLRNFDVPTSNASSQGLGPQPSLSRGRGGHNIETEARPRQHFWGGASVSRRVSLQENSAVDTFRSVYINDSPIKASAQRRSNQHTHIAIYRCMCLQSFILSALIGLIVECAFHRHSFSEIILTGAKHVTQSAHILALINSNKKTSHM